MDLEQLTLQERVQRLENLTEFLTDEERPITRSHIPPRFHDFKVWDQLTAEDLTNRIDMLNRLTSQIQYECWFGERTRSTVGWNLSRAAESAVVKLRKRRHELRTQGQNHD